LVGHISVYPSVAYRQRRGDERSALMMPLKRSTSPEAELHAVKLLRWSERGIVLRGIEEEWKRKQCTPHRQAWWIVPVDKEEVDTITRPPIDADDEDETLAGLPEWLTR
jgi:hypothetical protein